MIHAEYLKGYGVPTGEKPASNADVIRYLILRGNMKYAFGLPLDEAALAYAIPTGKGMYEVSDSRVGLHEAETLWQFSAESPYSHADPVLSLYEGSGNTSWALATAFACEPHTRIESVELDPTIAVFAKNNAIKAGFGEKVKVTKGNAKEFLARDLREHKRYRAIFLDPPWPITTYTASRMRLEEVNPDIAKLVSQAVELAPVVAFHAPEAITDPQLTVLGEQLKRNVVMQSHHIEGQNPAFTIKTIYLTKSEHPSPPKKADLILPSQATLWMPR